MQIIKNIYQYRELMAYLSTGVECLPCVFDFLVDLVIPLINFIGGYICSKMLRNGKYTLPTSL